MRLVGVKSLRRNLETEDSAFREQTERDMIRESVEIYEEESADMPDLSVDKGKGTEEMEIMAANTGDIHIYKKDSPDTPPVTPSQPIVQPDHSLRNSLIVAVGLLSGLASIGWLLRPTTPVDPTKPPTTVAPGYDIESVIKPSFGEQE